MTKARRRTKHGTWTKRTVAREITINSQFSPLHIAAVEGTSKEIERFLLLDVPIDNRDRHEMTPLHLCASRGTLRNMKVLIAAGADLNAVDYYGLSALHHAVTNRNTSDIISYLFEIGFSTKSLDYEGNTPLHICALKGNLRNLKVLLDLDSDLSKRNVFGQTALHQAAMSKDNAGVLAYLLDKGMSMDTFDDLGQAAIHRCASFGNKKNLQVFIEKGCDIDMKNIDGLTPLCCALFNPNARDMIKYLLSQRAAINSRDKFGNIPLHAFAAQATIDIVKLLVDHGADIRAKDVRGATILHYAVDNEKWRVLEFFVEKGIPLEAQRDDGATVLLDCAGRGTLQNLKTLVQKGANVQAQDKAGRTALHYAALNADAAPIVEFLLKQGLSIDARDNFGRTPLHYASKIGTLKTMKALSEENAAKRRFRSKHPVTSHGHRTETLKCLLKRGASIKVKDKDGRTPLLACASGGNLQKLKLLVEKGADIHERDDEGRSSLHLAAANKQTTDIMQYLLDEGIPLELRDKSGVTPLLFSARGALQNVKFLCEKGADLLSLDYCKWTALHHAAANKEGGPIIEYLLAKGIPVDVRNDMGQSPFHIARGCGIAKNGKILLVNGMAQAETNPTLVLTRPLKLFSLQ